MKLTLLIVAAIFFFLVTGCKNDTSHHSEKLEKALANLTQLALSPKEERAMLSLIRDSTHLQFPVYSLQGEKISQAQIQEKEMNVTVDCYGESMANIKAVIFRDLTQAELDK